MLLYLRKISLFLILYISLFCINSYAKDFPLIWNISNTNEYFVGRKIILDNLHKNFRNGHNIITIVGSSGIGKTQIVKRFAENYKNEYDVIWWIDSEKNIEEQFKKLAIEWNRINAQENLKINTFLPAKEVVKQLLERLRVTDLSFLIIFDNALEKNKISDFIPVKHNKKGRGDVLITSKNPLSWSNIMEIEKFTRQESIELLIKITNENDNNAANELAEILKDYPLALVQAASYIKLHPSINLTKYKDLFITKRKDLWREENNAKSKHAAFDNYDFTVYTTLAITMKQIEAESPEAANLMAFCSFLNSKNIPEELLNLYISKTATLDQLKQSNIIAILVKYSLLHPHQIHSPNIDGIPPEFLQKINSTFSMHEIPQLAIQEYFIDKNRAVYLAEALEVMADFLPDKLDIMIPLLTQYEYLLPHIEKLIFYADNDKFYNNDILTIKLRLLEYYLPGIRDYKKSEALIADINNSIKHVKEVDKIILVRFASMKSAYFTWYKADYEQAINEVLPAIQFLKGMKDKDEEYLMIYNRLAQLYNLIADRVNALKYADLGNLVIKESKGFLGNQDAFFQTLAKIYVDEGEYEKALSYAIKSIEKLAHPENKMLPGDIPIYLTKVDVLIRLGRSEEAYKEAKELYDVADKALQNSNHNFMARVQMYYAYCSFLTSKTGKYEKEKELIEKSQTMLIHLLGDGYKKSPYLAALHKFLGDIYEKEKDYTKAQAEYDLAEQIFGNIYDTSKKVSTDDISDLYAKLAIINVELAEPVTAQKYLTLLQNNFGFDHPRTVKITEYFIDHGMKVGY